MKKLLLLLPMVGFVLFSAAQQTTSIKGKITGNSQEGLSGATVIYSAANKSAVADEKGNFVIDGLPVDQSVLLKISYTGYVATEKSFNLTAAGLSDVVISLASDALSLTDVTVTGVSNPRSRLSSSVSTSTLRSDDISKSAARTTAEIFRSIPGIKSEASGGDGNTNITVRGVPISAGGSKYLQLQEDGLPVMQFGDIAFATQDIFLRADQSLAKIEAIRGGSASTMATNSPAGIINFISKTGNTEGGSVSTTTGLDYNSFRTDFNYGAPISNGLFFNVGGFYRLGEGPRTAGYTSNNGGQLKFNMTKQFKGGFARVYFKYLNDRAAAYMPMPIQVSGTNAKPVYSSLPGFDALNGTIHSPYLLQNLGTGVNGDLRRSDVSDGMHPISKSVGLEFNFDLGEGWKIENRGRLAINNGRFVTPFPASVGTTASILSSIAGATTWDLTGATVKYANTNAIYTGTNAMMMHMFDVELNNFDNFVNDFKLKKKFKNGEINFGFYKSYQNISMSWLWNSYMTDVNGNGTRPLDIYNASATKLTQNGLFAYGVPAWGNCCTRSYDTKYSITAPSISISLNATKELSFDGGLRWDMGDVTGSYAGAVQSERDVNNDGVISANEHSVSSVNIANPSAVNYKYDYPSFSIGANYQLSESKAVFGRFSDGASAKADRILFTPNVFADGNAKGVTDKITQAELGYKSNYKMGGIFVTAFYANVNEAGGFEATTQKVIENHYKSFGLELEANINVTKNLNVRANATYTKAEITDGANKGNQPRRQAPFIYNVVPTYTKKNFSVGMSVIGTSSSFSQDNNKLKFNGYAIVNPFVTYKLTKNLSASLNANNIFNTFGITEAEEDSIVENTTNIIRARSITGRTISATIGFNF